MPPTPPPSIGTAPQMPEVGKTIKEKILGGLGGVLAAGGGRNYDDTELGKALAAHHKKRQDEAAMYWQSASQYYALSIGAYDDQGNPMTDEKRQEYRNKADAAYEAYAKIAGFSKESKAAIAQAKQKLDQGLPFLQQHVQNQVPSPSSHEQGHASGMTSPPSASSTPALSRPTPPPSLSRADIMAPPDAAHGRALGEEKDLLTLQHKFKMEEEQAKITAKAQSGSTPRPVHSGSIGVLDARKLADAGQIFMNEQGDPIDLSQLDDSMGLYGIIRKNTDQNSPNLGKWETVYTPFSPSQRTVTAGNETYAVSPYDLSKLPGGAGADLGQHTTPKSGTHQVITIGKGGEPVPSTLTSTSTPSTPGIRGRGVQAKPTPPPSIAAPNVAPSPTGGPGKGTTAPAPKRPAGPAGPGAAAGGIKGLPPGTYSVMLQRATPVRLAATQLFGDPHNSKFKPLSSYGDVVDNPAGRDRVATAWNLIRNHMDAATGGETSGDLITIIKNYIGTPGAVAESEVAKMQEALDALTAHPREAELLNRLFSTYGTVIGLRSLTRGSAARFSARNMEQEVPIPGMNIRNSKQFYDKLSVLAEEVNNGWKGVPDIVTEADEREFDLAAQAKLEKLAKTGRPSKGPTPPPSMASPSKTEPMTVDEFKKKHQIH